MAIASSAALVDMLRQSGVLGPAQIDQLAPSLQERPRDAGQLAEDLVRQGWLTAYQAEQLLQGNASELVLGPYIVLEPAGKGQVGHVYRARHRKRGHVVAVKVIRKNLRADPQVLQRFRREVRSITRLAHPNLVRACDVEEVGNAHFYAMEYVDGVNLDELIDHQGALPIGPACDYVRQAALGLQHAHEHGMVHRDIKPANLLIAPAAPGARGAAREGRWGTIKLLDLGLALVHRPIPAAGADQPLTMPGFTLGSVDYMAPEQVLRPHEVDIRADLYGLGCVMYHMITGRPPFPDGSLIEKLAQHRRDEPALVESLRPEVPPALAGVLRKMMAKKPEARYQTPAEVAQVLATILTRLDPAALALDWQPSADAPRATATSPSPRRQGTTALPAPATQYPLWLAALILAIFIGTFVLFWLLLAR